MSPSELLEGILHGGAAVQRRAIAKSITLLESTRADHRLQADALLTAATAELDDPLFWWELADDAELDPSVHRERGKRYGYKYPEASGKR